MKTRSKLFAGVAVVILTALLAACSNGLFGGADIETRPPTNPVYAKINVNVTNYSEVILDTIYKNEPERVAANARTIAPALAAEDYKIYLFGENGAAFCGPYDLTGELFGTGGSFQCSVPTGVWNLTLVALPATTGEGDAATETQTPTREECKAGLADKALLKGRSYVDLTGSTVPNVNFVLSPEGLSTKGTVKFTIILDGWTSLDKPTAADPKVKATAGIYDLKTGKAIEYESGKSTEHAITFKAAVGTDDKTCETKAENQKTILAGTEYAVYDVSKDSKLVELDPGTYSFVLTFENTSTKKKWTWNDRIMIFPGDTVDKTVYVSRLIMDAPKAPEYLYASVKAVADHDAADPFKYQPKTDDAGRLYQVIFDWADWASDGKAIDNETHFELQVADVSGIKPEEIEKALTPPASDAADDADDANKYWKLTTPADPKSAPYVTYTKVELDLDAKKKYQYEGKDDANKLLDWKLKTKETADFNATDKNPNVNVYGARVFDILPTYVDGSLIANNTSITLFLELGKEYIARIAAVNDTDRSPWTYCKLEPVEGHTGVGTSGTPTLSGVAFRGKTINNYSVKYMLNNGKDPEDTKLQGNYVEIFGPQVKAVAGEGETPAVVGGTVFQNFFKGETDKGLARGGVKVTGWKDGPESNARDYYISKPTKQTNVPGTVGDAPSGSSYAKKRDRTLTKKLYNGTQRVQTIHEYNKAADASNESSGWVTISVDPPTVETTAVAPADMITYEGYENLTLWAQYSKEFTWNMITDYALDPTWVRYQVLKSDKTVISDADAPAYPEYKKGTDAVPGEGDNPGTPAVPGGTTITDKNGNGAYTAEYHPVYGKDYGMIKWSITLPEATTDSTWNYRYARVIINRSDGSGSTVTMGESNMAGRGEPTVIYTDVSDCVQGQYYNVLIEVGVPNSTLIETMPVVLYVR